MSNIHPLMNPRRKVIVDYPESPFSVNEILSCNSKGLHQWYEDNGERRLWLNDWPHIFMPLNWYEHRYLDEMYAIEYIRISKYTDYWRVGDVLKVDDYLILPKDKSVTDFIKGGRKIPVYTVIPITEEQFNSTKNP